MKLTRIFLFSFVSAVLIALPVAAYAGSFKVSPIRVYMETTTKRSVIKVTNDGDEKVTAQIEAKEWTQGEDGADKYADTKDIVFFPKIMTIEKGEERVVRVGWQGKPSLSEKTYRIFIQELPVKKPGETALIFALKLGVPVFIKPVKEVKQRTIEKAAFADGSLKVTFKNSGNAHYIVTKIIAKGADESGNPAFTHDMGGWYVLPGVTKTFSMDIAREDCLKAVSLAITAEIENGKLEAKAAIDKAQCTEKKAAPAKDEPKDQVKPAEIVEKQGDVKPESTAPAGQEKEEKK